MANHFFPEQLDEQQENGIPVIADGCLSERHINQVGPVPGQVPGKQEILPECNPEIHQVDLSQGFVIPVIGQVEMDDVELFPKL